MSGYNSTSLDPVFVSLISVKKQMSEKKQKFEK